MSCKFRTVGNLTFFQFSPRFWTPPRGCHADAGQLEGSHTPRMRMRWFTADLLFIQWCTHFPAGIPAWKRGLCWPANFLDWPGRVHFMAQRQVLSYAHSRSLGQNTAQLNEIEWKNAKIDQFLIRSLVSFSRRQVANQWPARRCSVCVCIAIGCSRSEWCMHGIHEKFENSKLPPIKG